MSISPQAAVSSVDTETDVRKVALAGGIGTIIEYYDYALYGYLAVILAPLFFPNHDPVASLLLTLAVFALSYVIRPIGGIVFGAFGDRHGRRSALLVTVIGIGTANTLIGLLPTYASVGVLASILLVIVRIGQGFFAGGEVGGAATVISEAAQPGHKARWGALVPMGTNGGFATASAVVGIVSGVLSSGQMDSWGWRIPFLLGAPLTIACYLARRSLPDIDQGIDQANHGFPLLTALRRYPGSLLQATALGIGVQGGAYIGSTFIAIYLVNNLKYAQTPVYWITAGATTVAVLLMPLTGRLADRVGPLPVATIGLVGYAVLTYPAFLLMDNHSLVLAALGYVMVMVNMSFVQVGSYTITPQLFGDQVRYTGTALATNLSVVIAGGTAPFVGTWLVEQTGNLRSPYYFVALTSAIGIGAVVAMWKLHAASHRTNIPKPAPA